MGKINFLPVYYDLTEEQVSRVIKVVVEPVVIIMDK
ncbi:MAG: hypothetical protein ACI9WV_000230 [Patiriisocius sp.]|jgi:hypothetical protein